MIGETRVQPDGLCTLPRLATRAWLRTAPAAGIPTSSCWSKCATRYRLTWRCRRRSTGPLSASRRANQRLRLPQLTRALALACRLTSSAGSTLLRRDEAHLRSLSHVVLSGTAKARAEPPGGAPTETLRSDPLRRGVPQPRGLWARWLSRLPMTGVSAASIWPLRDMLITPGHRRLFSTG